MEKIRVLISKIKYAGVKDLAGFFIFAGMLLPALVFRLYCLAHRRRIWLLSENLDCMTACDNAYNFFEFMMKREVPEGEQEAAEVYFVINGKSPYLEKTNRYKDRIVRYASIRHWLYYLTADKLISTHILSAPSGGIFYVLWKFKIGQKNHVFLQHGITQADLPELYYENSKTGLFICGAKKEYDCIRKNFHYPEANIKYTGFARFDALHNVCVKKRQVLIMPTWRRWIALDMVREQDIVKTRYYQEYQKLLNHPKLKQFVQEKEIQVIFYVHQMMEKYIHYFSCDSPRIIIASRKQYDVQELIRESGILITDYSSVFFDFAYMKKPILYFHFDREEFIKKQYKEGYFSYEEDGFGPVLQEADEVADEIQAHFSDGFYMGNRYLQRTEEYFVLNDDKNCERILYAIRDML